MKRGLKKFKKKAKIGNCRTRTSPLERRIPTSENREPSRKKEARVARPANVPKKNRDGSIKGRGVADGRKQWEKIEPKDAAPPKVSTEAVMLTSTIDAL